MNRGWPVQLRTRAGSDLRVRPLSMCRLRCASGADLRTLRRSAHVPDVRGLLSGARIAGRRPIKALNCPTALRQMAS